jgi:hypothetical protein
LLELPAKPARVLLVIYDLILAAAGLGLLLRLVMQPEKRYLICLLLALLVLQSVFVCAVRAAMPPWMIYAQWPLIAALIALGLEGFCTIGTGARAFIAAALLVMTLCTFDAYARLASGPLDHADIKASPGKLGIMDVRDYEKDRYHYRLARIPFRQLFAIGDPLCSPVVLFGHYAYLVDYTFAVSAWAKCGRSDTVQFGGIPREGQRALLGLHVSVWREIGMLPARWIGQLGVTEPIAIWHSPVPLKPVFPRLTTFPRTFKIDVRKMTISGDAPPNQAILVSQRAHRYAPFEVIGARANGEEIKPVYVDSTAVIFLAPPQLGHDVHWDIDVQAAVDYIDVLTFKSTPPNRS